MTTNQLQILQHALGLDEFGQGSMYRNHYVGGENECRPLVALGYMVERPGSELTGGDPCFHVTEAGKQAVKAESPKPPKLSRGQQRYREYLRSGARDLGDMHFGDWLKWKAAQKQREVPA